MKVLAFWALDPELSAVANSDNVLGLWRRVIQKLSCEGVLPFRLTDDNPLQAVRQQPITAIAVTKEGRTVTLHIIFRTCYNHVSSDQKSTRGYTGCCLYDFGASAKFMEFIQAAPAVTLLTSKLADQLYKQVAA